MTQLGTRLTVPSTLHRSTSTLTVGVLVGWLDDGSQVAVIDGLLEAASESGANLVCLNATALHAPSRFGERANNV